MRKTNRMSATEREREREREKERKRERAFGLLVECLCPWPMKCPRSKGHSFKSHASHSVHLSFGHWTRKHLTLGYCEERQTDREREREREGKAVEVFKFFSSSCRCMWNGRSIFSVVVSPSPLVWSERKIFSSFFKSTQRRSQLTLSESCVEGTNWKRNLQLREWHTKNTKGVHLCPPWAVCRVKSYFSLSLSLPLTCINDRMC